MYLRVNLEARSVSPLTMKVFTMREGYNMLYNSSKHGLIEIATMPQPHVVNALNKLKRQTRKSSTDYEMIGALKQSLKEREVNPSTSLLKAQLDSFKDELSEVKTFQNELKSVVNKY